jgi:hypothetical protein
VPGCAPRRCPASPGGAGTTSSSTRAWRERNAFPSEGSTVEDVSAGVRSRGEGTITQIDASAGKAPRVVPHKGDRAPRKLGRKPDMLGAADDIEIRLREPIYPRAQGCHPRRGYLEVPPLQETSTLDVVGGKQREPRDVALAEELHDILRRVRPLEREHQGPVGCSLVGRHESSAPCPGYAGSILPDMPP